MFFNIPLTIVPLIVFNLFAFGWLGSDGGDPWLAPVLTLQMMSDARFTMTTGDAMIIAGIAFLFIEILKATRTSSASLADHLLSMVAFVVYLVEFLTVPQAAQSVFFILGFIAFVDVVAGFSISITGARRDFGYDRG